MTWNQELGACAAALGLAQLFTAWRFHRLARAPSGRGTFHPPASLLVACKGTGTSFAENARALMTQDYPGKLEVLFVVPSQDDPAYGALKALDARVIASGLVPSRCSGKIADILFALDRLSPESELLAFADSDLRVGRDWLAELAAPLADAETTVTTSAMLYAAPSPDFWTLLRSLWTAAGIPYLALMDCVTGQSCAMRRSDFERLGIKGLWAASLMEDLSLARRVRERGGRIRFVARAMPASEEPCDRRTYFGVFNKWMVCFRVYDPFIWLLALISTSAHLTIAACGFIGGPRWNVLALLFCADAAYLAAVGLIFSRTLDRRPFPLWAAAAAPLLWATYAVQLANSLWTRDIRWGGRVYRLHGPQEIEVLG